MREEVLVIKRAGIVAALPKMTGGTFLLVVDVAGESLVRAPERLRHGRRLMHRQHDPMDMIRHQAAAVKFEAVSQGGPPRRSRDGFRGLRRRRCPGDSCRAASHGKPIPVWPRARMQAST